MLPINEMRGVGTKTAEQMTSLGIHNGKDCLIRRKINWPIHSEKVVIFL